MASAAGVSGSQLSLIPWNRQKKLDFLDKNVYIVAQTTFNDVKFKDIVEFLEIKDIMSLFIIPYVMLPRNDREKQERLQLMLIP